MFNFKSAHDDPSRIYEENVFSAFLSFLPPALIWGTSLAWETSSAYGLVTQHHLRVLLRVQKRQMKGKHTQSSVLHISHGGQRIRAWREAWATIKTEMLLLVLHGEILCKSGRGILWYTGAFTLLLKEEATGSKKPRQELPGSRLWLPLPYSVRNLLASKPGNLQESKWMQKVRECCTSFLLGKVHLCNCSQDFKVTR